MDTILDKTCMATVRLKYSITLHIFDKTYIQYDMTQRYNMVLDMDTI